MIRLMAKSRVLDETLFHIVAPNLIWAAVRLAVMDEKDDFSPETFLSPQLSQSGGFKQQRKTLQSHSQCVRLHIR